MADDPGPGPAGHPSHRLGPAAGHPRRDLLTAWDGQGRPLSDTIVLSPDADGLAGSSTRGRRERRFRPISRHRPLRAAPGSAAYGHYDLLTALLHELGHVEGFMPVSVGFEALRPERRRLAGVRWPRCYRRARRFRPGIKSQRLSRRRDERARSPPASASCPLHSTCRSLTSSTDSRLRRHYHRPLRTMLRPPRCRRLRPRSGSPPSPARRCWTRPSPRSATAHRPPPTLHRRWLPAYRQRAITSNGDPPTRRSRSKST